MPSRLRCVQGEYEDVVFIHPNLSHTCPHCLHVLIVYNISIRAQKNTADLDDAGWFIFFMLMTAFLAKDMINGSKLLYYSSKSRHLLGPRIRYFIGGICLCSITLFALYVSTVYNRAIATSNTDIIVNSVVVLFIMEIDEYIFAALKASNEKWTAHAAESEDSRLLTEVSEMKEKAERQRAQIESQQEQINDQQGQITDQREELKMLREMVEKIQEAQAATAAASNSESTLCEGNIDAQLMEQVNQNQNTMPSESEQNVDEFKAAATTLSKTFSQCQCTAHESMTTHADKSESGYTGYDTDAGKGGTTNEMNETGYLV
mmetsp:Transcript_12901/g.25990  ORF Transcript_12901/g.25990 Transcript_12901/m.25990 type:complete len:318 (+) Transcript_12901:494-1447(+)